MTVRVGVIYKSSQVMNKLQIKDSVFKKYIPNLETAGYIFERNDQDHRLFFDKDIKTLEMFMEMIQYDGVTIEMAAKKISEMNGYDSIPDKTQKPHDVMTLMTQLLEDQRIIFEKQSKEHEQQFAIKMQEILEERLEEQEKRILNNVQLLKQSMVEEFQEVKQIISTDKQNKPITLKGWIKSWWK